MAEVFPLRGWRYDPGQVDPGLVTAPPYDVIDRRGQDFYHERHPMNVIRLILGCEEAGDDETRNKYARARDHLADWRRRGILRQEETPVFYLYEQAFSTPYGTAASRVSIIADVALSPFAKGIIRPHERTLSQPKEDRLKLMRATGFQLSQVFLLYEDPAAELRPYFERRPEEAVADLVDPEGVRHRLWLLGDCMAIDKIKSFFTPKPLYIADGHHRFETARAYRGERLAAGQPLGRAGTVAAVLTEMDQPGLLVFPTHRAVHSLPAWDEECFRAALGRFFRLAPFAGGAHELAQAVRNQAHAFGFVFRGGLCFATVTREAEAVAAMPANRPLVWRRLDVSLLHGLVLGRILGFSLEAQERQENLTYTRDPDEVAAMVGDGRAQFGVLLSPTAVREVKEIADAGETMPQKSTYFWPKLLSGLVMKEL